MQQNTPKEKKSLASKFVGNTGWMMFRNIYSMLISLIVGSLSARYLGPSNYGVLNYGSSIIAFFTTVSKLGMDAVVVAEMTRNPQKEGSYLGSALVMRLLTSVLSFFAICGIVAVLEPDDRLLQVVTMLQAIAIIFQSSEVLYFWFQARLEMKYVTIAAIAALTATGIWRISLLANAASVEWFALSASVSALVCGACTIVFFAKKAKLKLKASIDDSKFILSNSYHFIINGLAVTLYTQIDRIMLGKVVSNEAVGFYAAASTIAVMWEFVPTALINSARPILIKTFDKDKSKFTENFQILLLGITLLGILVGIFFTTFAKPIVYLLYTKKYAPSIPCLSILIWSTSFAMIGTARGVWIVAERYNKFAKYLTLTGCFFNLVTNAIVIPHYGIIGASFTTLLSQMLVALVSPLFFKETRPFVKLYLGSFGQFPKLFQTIKGIVKK